MCSSPADITAKALSRTYKMTSELLKNVGFNNFLMAYSLHVYVVEGRKYCLIHILLCRAQNFGHHLILYITHKRP